MISRDDASLTAMVGGGFHNRNAAMQAAGIANALPAWEEACRGVVPGEEPIVICDYGCS